MVRRPRRGGLAVALAGLSLVAACSSSGGGGGPSSSAPTPSPTTTTTTVTPTPTAGSTSRAPVTASGTPRTGSGPAVVHQTLANFRVVDVSYVGSQAWALGSADCLSGSGTCDAVEYSGDGGRTWRSAPAPKAGIDSSTHTCTETCVTHIRFATGLVGYAYDRHSFFTTADGGNTWTNRSGDADALESLDGNVIRVRTDTPDCPPGCTFHVETAAIGSTSWHRVPLPGAQQGRDTVTLVRTGNHSYLQAYGNPAGGAQSATSVLWSSTDNGQSWTNRGEVCPQVGGEVDSDTITAAPDGAVAVLCVSRLQSGRRVFVAVSTDGGAHFRAASTTALGSAPVTATALGSSTLVFVSSDQTYRSTNGGARFSRLNADAGNGPGQLASLGFASSAIVHGVSTDDRSIWTSTDAGRTWTAHRF